MSEIKLKDTLVKTLEENPDLYKILNSKDHMKVLDTIYKGNSDFANIKRIVKLKKDTILYNILDTLINKKLIKKININKNNIYYITSVGKKFFELYKNTKEEFTI
jgi:predicted transcriptional regulator